MERLIVEEDDMFWIKGHTADSCLDICDEIKGECWHCAIMSCMEKLAVYEDQSEKELKKIESDKDKGRNNEH